MNDKYSLTIIKMIQKSNFMHINYQSKMMFVNSCLLCLISCTKNYHVDRLSNKYKNVYKRIFSIQYSKYCRIVQYNKVYRF